MVLSDDQAFRFDSTPAPGAATEPPKAEKPAPKPIAIQYLGFKNVGARREYLFQAGRGELATRHVVSIELAAFSLRQALLQDGPDICYQKLVRALAGELPVADALEVTEADLAEHRAAHTVPNRRRSFSAPPPPAPGTPKS